MADISVIIVNHNAAPYVRAAIASLPAATRHSFETLVMDNSAAPTDDCGADIYRTVENRGFGAACNEGAALASGELLLFLNPDSQLQPGALDAACRMLEETEKAGLVGIRTLLPDGRFEPGCLRGFPTPGRAAAYYLGLEKLFPKSRLCGGYHMTWLDRTQNQEVDCVSGSFMLLRRALFEELGGFDEDFFMYGEDVDLCHRIALDGWEIVYLPDAVITHLKGQSGLKSRSPKVILHFYKSMWLFYTKNLSDRYNIFVDVAVYLAISVMYSLATLRTIAEGMKNG